jgi:hypothetical protein
LTLSINDEEKAKEDPLINYGAGLLGFRHITGALTLVFLVLTLLSVPIIFIYSNGGEVVDKTIATSYFGIYTLANMG